jgi:hypothetical protein
LCRAAALLVGLSHCGSPTNSICFKYFCSVKN